jgi:hypothetical protein
MTLEPEYEVFAMLEEVTMTVGLERLTVNAARGAMEDFLIQAQETCVEEFNKHLDEVERGMRLRMKLEVTIDKKFPK